jgi:preprotein translocase subunit SecE
MSLIKANDSKKWIHSLVAIVGFIVAFVVIRFVTQMGEWFDLEASISNFGALTQGLGVASGLVFFIAIVKNKGAQAYMQDVYGELTKVIWPNKDDVVKVTIGIVIALIIASSIFLLVDWTFRKILELIY